MLRVLLIVIAVLLGVWVILPDPVPAVVDDVLAALGCAAAILAFRKTDPS